MEMACQCDWPGKARALQKMSERAVILTEGGTVKFELPQRLAARTLDFLTSPVTNEIEK